MLLRAGAEVIVATRFPRDAARRFAPRARRARVDARGSTSTASICATRRASSCSRAHLLATLPRLDALINNACQTVRRPAGWYDHVDRTARTSRAARARVRARRARAQPRAARRRGRVDASSRAAASEIQATGLWKLAPCSRRCRCSPRISSAATHLYPQGRLDQDLQQVDLRDFNSWRMTLADVPTAELLEVHLVNAVAPFVLNARLRPLLAAVPTRDAHVVNVSAMEGQFYRRWKTDKHPHTNMAKAALNMMTRTSARRLRARRHPHEQRRYRLGHRRGSAAPRRSASSAIHGFHPPLDIVDGAARIVDPLFDGINTGNHLWGLFLKDYKPAPW